MADDLVNITIDGHKISVPKGTLLVEAARQIGLEIPVYCYHPKMEPVGACRVCVVEVENQRRPIMTACTTTVMPDMVVHTKSEEAIKAREGILEFLLINHPLDCPVCDRGGECDLQDFTLRYGPPTTRFVEEKRHFEKSLQVGANVVLDRERCIMCQRCVRFCDEIAMEEGLVIIERGYRSEIGTFEGRSYDSKFSGNVIELCPVGALTARTYRFESRPWEQQQYAGICNVSSIGTNITIDVRFDDVIRIRSRLNEEIDDGWLTDDTRYSHLPIHSEDRIARPMVRNSAGDLEMTSWEEAMKAVKDAVSGATVGIAVGDRLSVEDGHALLHLGRGVLETPHVIHEYAHEQLSTDRALTGRIVGCDEADAIILVGCDPAVTHPAFELRVKKGLRKRARLICLGAEPALEGFADHQATGEPDKLWAKLVMALKKKSGETEESGVRLPRPRPWEAGGHTSEDWDELVDTVRVAEKVLVVVSGDLDAQKLNPVIGDVESLGWNNEPHGVIHLRHGVNSLGLEMVGLQPTWNEDTAEPYRKAWGTFNATEGKGFDKLHEVDVLLSAGCDVLSREGWKKPKFLVAAATHPNATTEEADVVLPLSTWVESNGVFVSTEGAVQFQRQAIVQVGDSKPAHQIAQMLVEMLEEEPAGVKAPRALYQELGELNPNFAGATYRDFRKPGQVHWSYPQQADLGMPRPDLSAIPVQDPDTPMWKPTEPTGSKVELASRLHRGQVPPAVPGQRNPREIAAMLGLSDFAHEQPRPALPGESSVRKEGYVPLRVLPASSAQPPGPSPASRHHELGMGRRKQVSVPTARIAVVEQAGEKAELPESPAAKVEQEREKSAVRGRESAKPEEEKKALEEQADEKDTIGEETIDSKEGAEEK